MADLLDRLKAALADRYRIERELGSGGMATVYLAQDLKHHRKVAVKVLASRIRCRTREARGSCVKSTLLRSSLYTLYECRS